MSKEFETCKDLIDLHSVLHKRVILGAMFDGVPPDMTDILLRAINRQSTVIGKTDSVIDDKEKEELDIKIEKVRNWLLVSGKCEDWDKKEVYGFVSDEIHVFANKTRSVKPDDRYYYLWMYAKDDENRLAELELSVDFQKTYRLEITFVGELPKTQRYYLSGEHKLEEMDLREYRIISFYLVS